MGKICQFCTKREAKIHFTEIKDGKKTEMHICERCAHEKNMVLAFPSLLSHIVKGAPSGVPIGESDAVPATCPSCGLAYSEFKSKGRLAIGTTQYKDGSGETTLQVDWVEIERNS